jgi:GNAT superfamily N-acetyltransferase
MSSYFLSHARRFGVGATAHYVAWRAADRFFGYMPYRCLVRPASGRRTCGGREFEGVECRELALGDFALAVADGQYDVTERFLSEANAEKYACFGAFSQNRLVGYAFASTRPTNIDADFRFHVPQGCLYSFKGFTLPEWRGKRIRALLMGAQQRLCDRRGLKGVVALSAATNYPSLISFDRLGFRSIFSFAIVGKGQRRWLARGRNASGGGGEILFKSDAGDYFKVTKIGRA